MIRPTLYETIEECRDFHLDVVQGCRDFAAVIESTIKKNPERDHTLARQVIATQKEIIRTTYADLKEMQRWWNKEGKNARERLLEKATIA